jgi:hypothetical protein
MKWILFATFAVWFGAVILSRVYTACARERIARRARCNVYKDLMEILNSDEKWQSWLTATCIKHGQTAPPEQKIYETYDGHRYTLDSDRKQVWIDDKKPLDTH